MVKIVVFDVDGTLLHRTVHKLPNKQVDARTNGRYIYYRPHLKELSSYLQRQSQQKSRFIPVMWSSMRGINAKPISQILKEQWNISFDRIFSQEYCKPDLSKDLEVIAKQYKVPIQEILLIDDSLRKRIGKQNFIHVKIYDGTNDQDKQILQIIENLEYIQKLQSLENPIFVDCETKQKYKQKLQEKHEVIPDDKLKVLVFDLNKTLVAKKKPSQMFEGWQSVTKIKGEHVYLRPNLQVLSLFQKAHKQSHHIKFLIWTIISSKKAASQYFNFLRTSVHMPFENIYDESLTQNGTAKNLQKICELYGCKLQNTILVDDSPYKSVGEQNYIQIQPFLGDKDDQQIIRIVEKLDKFIDCKQNCLIKQLLNSQIQVPELILTKEIKITKQTQVSQKKEAHNKKVQQKKFHQLQKSDESQDTTANEKIEQNKLIQPLQLYLNPNHKPIKCLVFDINETLLKREQKLVQGVPCNKKTKRHYNYLRPNLKCLQQFFQANPKIKKCLWTTIMHKNSTYMRGLLEQSNLHFDFMLTQEDLIQNKKDLAVVQKVLKIQTDEIVLIDDNIKKMINGQNFIHVKAFDPRNQNDEVLISLAKQLQEIVKMK